MRKTQRPDGGAAGSKVEGRGGRPSTQSPESLQDLSSMLVVYDGQVAIGHLLPRGKLGVEAFDAADRSLGIFPDLTTAANALERGCNDA